MNIIAKLFKRYPKFVWQLRSFKHFRRFINFNNPINLYEFIARNAVYYDERWCPLADKYEVRETVRKLIGEKYLNELYAVYDNPEEIDIDKLPKTFILKTTNGCATNIIVHDKNSADWNDIKAKLGKWLNMPYGEMTGQPHYSVIKPRIIAEKLMVEKGKSSLTDYKFYCVHGKPVYVLVCANRKINSHLFEIGAFDMDWKPLPSYLHHGMPHASHLEKPQSFDEMKSVVAKLADGFDFVRVDFYDIDGCPIFGEYTFTPNIIDLLSDKCCEQLYYNIKYQ